jgi:hypothetical protein
MISRMRPSSCSAPPPPARPRPRRLRVTSAISAESLLPERGGEGTARRSQREEEWEKLGAKASENLISKVDSLAEDFLKSTGPPPPLASSVPARGVDSLAK